jgi:hypothetical protein
MAGSRGQNSYTVISLLRFLAYVAWIVGLIYTVVTTTTLEYINAGARIGQFLFGLLITLPSGGVLYGLAHLMLLFQERSEHRSDTGQEG